VEIRRLNELKATNPYLRLGTDVSDLEKSIQTLGLIAPLVISPDNVILAGARRFQALLNLGYTEAPVMIVDKGALESELVSIDENLVRKDLSKIEVEGHLRRAKEIYQKLNPYEEAEVKTTTDGSEESEIEKKKVVLPAEKFLNLVAEKTGLSPKQIHEAINRDEMASAGVKEARKNGQLSLSQTNEIVKLKKDEQQKSLAHLKALPVREIKNFVKIAKTKGVDAAIKETPNDPNAREFLEIEMTLKKLLKKFKQLELEGITLSDLPKDAQKLFSAVMKFAGDDAYYPSSENESFVEESLQ
jgi:ParB family chromosome partitioning protein